MAAPEDKRTLILQAAVRVFAAEGYEAARVGDIAREAGVAYGLVYHYFGSKEAVLEAVFREQWGRLLAAVALAEETGEDAAEQLELVVKIVLRSWRDDPDLVRLLVREITRSPHIQDELDEIGQAFATFQRVIERGQRGRHVPGRPRRPDRCLDALRRARRGADRLGARAAPGRRRGGRGRRARGDRHGRRRPPDLFLDTNTRSY